MNQYRRQWKRYIVANLRDLRVLVGQFRVSLLLFVALLLLGGLVLHWLYVEPGTGRRPGYIEAVYDVFTMAFFATAIPFPPHNLLLQLLFFAVPTIGLAIIAEGVIRFGVALFNKQARGEGWQMALASTYRNHIIVCGLGRVGYRVTRHLLELGEEVVGVELQEEGRFVEAIRDLKVPVLIADVREGDVLDKVNVRQASAIVCCTHEDLTNLEVALDARQRNPDIKVVLRMFDSQMAERVKQGFGIHTAFSASALAAPVFAAAATRAKIDYSFFVGDLLLNVSQVTIHEESPLIGTTIARLEKDLDLSVIFYKSADKVDLHPDPDIVLQAQNCIVVSATLDALGKLTSLARRQDWRREC
jgi:voltage-gated potassium channel